MDLQRKYCHWDALGNLDQRIDHVAHMKEIFSYDGLNRVATVTTQALAGAITTTVPPPQTYEYDAKGNLKTKEGATMAYGGSRPHAVVSATVKGAGRIYGYDDSGYVTSDSKRTYQWSSFGQLEKLIYAAAPALKDLSGLQVRGGGEVVTKFSFDAAGSRARQEKDRVATTGVRNYEDTLYLGSYEREIHSTAPNSSSSPTVTKTIHRHTLGGIGVYTKKVVPSSGGDVTTVKLTTVLKDHLGSTSVLYTGTWNAGTSAFANPEIENQSFNPWGERRDAATWANFRTTDSDAFRTSAQDYDRGYTGHEQLDDSGLIHMNGRIYDPEIGRFLSPDPYVQVPEYSQNFNRYSYVMNNPLNAVDPSGFSWISDVFHNLGDFIRQNWRTAASMVFALAVTYFTAGIVNPFVSGFVGGSATGAFGAAINGGNSDAIWRGALVSGIQGGISSGILHPIGAAAAGSGNLALYGLHIVGHGLVGGAANEAMGGKFQDGFLSAAVSTAAGDMGLYSFIQGEDIGARAGRTFVAGIVGGTASQIGGGKFSNGFYTAAFQHLLNEEYWNRNFNAYQAGADWLLPHLGARSGISVNGDKPMIIIDETDQMGRDLLLFPEVIEAMNQMNSIEGAGPVHWQRSIGGVKFSNWNYVTSFFGDVSGNNPTRALHGTIKGLVFRDTDGYVHVTALDVLGIRSATHKPVSSDGSYGASFIKSDNVMGKLGPGGNVTVIYDVKRFSPYINPVTHKMSDQAFKTFQSLSGK